MHPPTCGLPRNRCSEGSPNGGRRRRKGRFFSSGRGRKTRGSSGRSWVLGRVVGGVVRRKTPPLGGVSGGRDGGCRICCVACSCYSCVALAAGGSGYRAGAHALVSASATPLQSPSVSPEAAFWGATICSPTGPAAHHSHKCLRVPAVPCKLVPRGPKSCNPPGNRSLPRRATHHGLSGRGHSQREPLRLTDSDP